MSQVQAQKKRKIDSLEKDEAERELAGILAGEDWWSNEGSSGRVVKLLERFPEFVEKEDVKSLCGENCEDNDRIFCVLASASENNCRQTFEKLYAFAAGNFFCGACFGWAFSSLDIASLKKFADNLPSEEVLYFITGEYVQSEQDDLLRNPQNPFAQLTRTPSTNAQAQVYQTEMDRLKVLVNAISAHLGEMHATMASLKLVQTALEWNSTVEVLQIVAKQFQTMAEAKCTIGATFDLPLKLEENAIIDAPQVEILENYVMPYIKVISSNKCKWTFEGYSRFLEVLITPEKSNIIYIKGCPIPSPQHHPQLYQHLNSFIDSGPPRCCCLEMASTNTFVEGVVGQVNAAVQASFETTVTEIVIKGGNARFDNASPQEFLSVVALLPCLNEINMNSWEGEEDDWTQSILSIMDNHPRIRSLLLPNTMFDWESFWTGLRRNTSLKELHLPYRLDKAQQQECLKVLKESNRTLLQIHGFISPELREQIDYRLLLNHCWPKMELAAAPATTLFKYVRMLGAVLGDYSDSHKTLDDQLNVMYALLRESPLLWAGSGLDDATSN